MIRQTKSSSKLPRRSFAAEPVHLRIAALCRTAVQEGGFTPGDRFPSERELAGRYGVSRATANKVISSLVSEGLLDLRKGIGTTVRKGRPLFASLDGMESFTAHVRAQVTSRRPRCWRSSAWRARGSAQRSAAGWGSGTARANPSSS